MEQFKKASENKIKQDIIITDHLYINEKKDTMFDKTEVLALFASPTQHSTP